MYSRTLTRLCGSSPASGSSRTTISGSCTSAIARFSRRFIPPDSVRACLLRFSSRPKSTSRRSPRLRDSLGRTSYISPMNWSCSMHVSRSHRTISCGHTPTRARTSPSPCERRALEQHPAGVRLEQAAHHVDRCRLARAVRTQEAEDLALADVEGEVVDGDKITVSLGQPLNPQHHVRHSILPQGAYYGDAFSPADAAVPTHAPQRAHVRWPMPSRTWEVDPRPRSIAWAAG